MATFAPTADFLSFFVLIHRVSRAPSAQSVFFVHVPAGCFLEPLAAGARRRLAAASGNGLFRGFSQEQISVRIGP
jgi:hypothetical protein